jgi:tetratricopeptide (TPR) repeat protein
LKTSVRLIITFCCFLALASLCLADTIVLKNGDRILVDSVRESNGRVTYFIGDNTFTIPKSIVARIEFGPGVGAPVQQQQRVKADDLPQFREPMAGADQLTARVIRDNQVDTAALKSIENEGVAAQSAVANSIAANFESHRNNLTGAAHYLENALRFLPTHPVLLESYASVLLQLGRANEALRLAEQAAKASAQSADAFALLGYALYMNDRNRDALAAWRRSLQLRPDDKIRQLMERVERESRTEASFRQQESSHFTLRYEGSQTADQLRQQILDALEADYRDLQNDLGAMPRGIFVSLYPDQAFFDVTQAPAWSAALNDGKIRLPISGVNSVTPQLARVLRHELTHSFVQQITHGRVPQWLNEGTAEMEEGLTTSGFGPRLANLFASGHQIPLGQLEANFSSYSAAEASVAYAESLAAVEFIRDTYGLGDVARILQRLGEGQSIESAMRSTIHSGYAELERDIAVYLKRKYGA